MNGQKKIQGRFEDIPFTESIAQMMRLMGEAINVGKEIKDAYGDRQEAKGKRDFFNTQVIIFLITIGL
ncbi:hypothetical protein [Cyanobacterium sp. Dongsha4]|uniref:hypothetical protein n=1 Tax=Cyanobacterium sp. DS4 TaxID=2878255 RepID=UPI002E82390D|nr:hypothetical protein [Cyanobacterium sp. Dongsha4]WVK99793.1 hypothetical protein Dongsha4_14100 [Cyanobacterium sp. Dongsha4]